MSASPQPETWLLVAVDADGRTGQPLARIASIEAVGAAAGRNGDLAPPLFVRTGLAGASEAALSAALRAGASGVLLLGGGGWDDVERLAVRIDVAEVVAGRPAGSVGLLAMTRDARGALARATPPPPIHRLIGIGIDTADFVLTGPASAALTTARGVTLLAAAAAGVPAFERRGGPATTPDLAASRADGFAWALVEDRDPPSA